MKPQALDELKSMLENNTDVLTKREAALQKAAGLKYMKADDGFALLEALIPLMYLKASTARSTDSIVKGLVAHLRAGGKDEARLDQRSVVRFTSNLTAILDLSNIAIKAKAFAIAGDSPRLYTTCKTLSDIRPVFGSDAGSRPVGAVILHNLRITYAEGGEEREFFVELDSRDLHELQENVKRALSKDAALRQFIAESQLQFFDTTE